MVEDYHVHLYMGGGTTNSKILKQNDHNLPNFYPAEKRKTHSFLLLYFGRESPGEIIERICNTSLKRGGAGSRGGRASYNNETQPVLIITWVPRLSTDSSASQRQFPSLCIRVHRVTPWSC